MTRTAFPIMLGDKFGLRLRRGEKLLVVKSIPWAMVDTERCRAQAEANHGQDPETLAARGGLSACEAICMLSGMQWQPIGKDEADAHRILAAMRDLFARVPPQEARP